MSEHAIEIHGVEKRFGATHAVRNLDLAVPTGSLCGFLGPNGAGKSTTIRMIMSIIYPDSGSIDVLGSDALHNKDRIGYLPEERGLYRKMRVAEFLEYIARLKGASIRDVRTHVSQWLERVELPEVAKQRCMELSKGMQQKIQFLASVIHEPDLIILDEPFSGLDPVNAELLNRLIRELHADGRTIIFSTHVLHQAEQICDRIFMINKGRKLLDATLDEIRVQFAPRMLVAEPLDGSVELTAEVAGVERANRRAHGPGFELHLDETSDPQAVMRDVMARHPMRAIEVHRPSLEDVFIQLVSADLGADAAREVREELSHV